MSESTVLVKYQTKKSYCSCCNQKLPEPKLSHIKEFRISKNGALSWMDWNEIADYPEDMESLVPEYVQETISFHAEDLFDQIIVDNSEIEKVKAFILQNVIGQEATHG